MIGAQGGLTALHFAARQGSAAAARALVDGGADVNLVSPGDKATPLLVALINGHFDLAAFLLENGADPNLLSDAGVSPLYAAINVQWAPIAAYPQPRAHLQQAHELSRRDEAAARQGRRSERPASPQGRGTRATTSINPASTKPARRAFWRAAYAADVAAMKLLVRTAPIRRCRR